MNKQLVGVMTWMVCILILLSGSLSFGLQNSGIGKTRGDLAGFDPSDNSLILSTKHGFVSLAVDAASEISRNGDFARAEDLRIGERLEVSYDRQRMVALTIRTDLGAVAGFITSMQISMDFREQYLVAITPEAAKPVLLVLSPRASITRDGVAVQPAALRIGDSASAVYDPATLDVVRLNVKSAAADPIAVKGVIVSVQSPNPGGPRPAPASILLKSGPQVFKFIVNKSTRIIVDGRPGTINDLKAGHNAVVSFDPVKKLALTIDAFSN